MTIKDQDEAELGSRRRVKRTRGDPKLYITFLPEGKGGPREDKGSVPLEVEVEAHIEERTDCAPGLYRIEKKRSGEFSGDVLFYSKEDAEVAVAIGELDDMVPAGETPDLPRLVASTVHATLDARDRRDRATMGQVDPMDQFRQMRELLKEERESGSSNQQDPIAMFERLVELQKKLTPEPPEPADSLSAKDRAQLMLVKESGLIPEFMRSMRDMLRAPEDAVEPKGFMEKALEYIQGWTPYIGPVLAPALGQKISEVVSRVNVDAVAQRMNGQAGPQITLAQPGPSAVSQPTAAPSAFPPELQSVEAELMDALSVVVDCMTLDTDDSDGEEHLECAAAAVRTFIQKNPVVAQPIVEGLFSQASASLQLQLSGAKPEWAYVAKLGNAAQFISSLKDELGGTDEAVDAPVEASLTDLSAGQNGTKQVKVS